MRVGAAMKCCPECGGPTKGALMVYSPGGYWKALWAWLKGVDHE